VTRKDLSSLIARSKARLSDPFDAARRRAATAIGAVTLGIVAILFAMLGDEAQSAFTHVVQSQPYLPLVITPLGFALVAWLTKRIAPTARGSGIPQVIAAGKNLDIAYGTLLSLPTAMLKLAFTVLILCVGGSVGREGPTVQVSAAIMVLWHRVFRVPMTSGVLIAGGAAGVAAAFNTPLAGVAFAIEELAAAFEQRVALLVMAAVVFSGLVSLGIAGDYVYFGVMQETLSVGSVVLIAPVAGIVGGAVGGLFSRLLLAASRGGIGWYDRLRARPIALAFACGLIVAALGVGSGGVTWGTGYETTRGLIENTEDPSALFGPLKFLATLATAVSGVPGGIFAPSLAVGAGFGHLMSFAFPDDPTAAIVLLGMIGYFVGVVRAPLTAVIILMETTASRGMILPLFLTALIADGVSKVVCREKLYHGLSRAFLTQTRTEPNISQDVPSAPPRNKT
jgi:H+/Cl- antiporter ClcA